MSLLAVHPVGEPKGAKILPIRQADGAWVNRLFPVRQADGAWVNRLFRVRQAVRARVTIEFRDELGPRDLNPPSRMGA